ncbi:MAG: hypothetical protein Q8880_10350 [Bacteroidota bacterium]|nr:hypothetical protein [Bacteroidota bacterium]
MILQMINCCECFWFDFINWTCLWTLVTAVATIGIGVIAYIQLEKYNNTAIADFALKFKNDFYNNCKTKDLLMLFEFNLLKFCQDKKEDNDKLTHDYFDVIENDLKKYKHIENLLNEKRKNYNSDEIDDNILGHYEDLGLFLKKGIISIDFIYIGFDYHIEKIYENDAIKDYIKEIRTQDIENEDIYAEFDYLYKRIQEYKITIYNKDIGKNPKCAKTYIKRGDAKIKLEQKVSACIDYRKALELGNSEANERIEKYCK